MKILNKARTHFMQPAKNGIYSVEYGVIKDVNEIINVILDYGNANYNDCKITNLLNKDKKI